MIGYYIWTMPLYRELWQGASIWSNVGFFYAPLRHKQAPKKTTPPKKLLV
jgi:hypothetical protein